MNARRTGLIIVCCAALAACSSDSAGDFEAGPSSPDGTEKESAGKGDAWDWRNDPARFRAELNYKWSELPLQGKSNKVAWADTYWPTYKDSINDRWQGAGVLSPVEKWDKAFNEWVEPDGFMDLAPYDASDCSWDPEYYEALGPAADWVSRNKGNWRSHNGIDDDGDGLADTDECGFGDEAKDRDGVETWWGLCHAWVPAAILEDEPQRAVEHNGVTFDVADLKALLVLQHDRSDAFMLGGRCNESDVERDDTGRLSQAQCRDVNAGSFHVIVTNFLGLQSRPIAEDRTFDYEVWNQPVVAYDITSQEELSVEEVNALLNVAAEPDPEAQPTSDEEIAAVLRAANELDETALIADAELREEEAAAIAAARLGADATAGTADDVVFMELAELEAIFEVGPRVLTRLLFYGRSQGWSPEPPASIYGFNDDATKFVRVKMALNYITESHALPTPTSDEISRYTRTDRYDYILEIDDNDEIVGGEWVGSSIQSHPDFLWLPIRAVSGSPHVDIEMIRELVRQSRLEEVTAIDFGSTDVQPIPDNDPEGLVSEVTIDDDGVIDSLELNLAITHTYRGDLLVQLEKVGTQTVVIFDGFKESERWQDDVKLEAEPIAGFDGVQVRGTWRLRVFDALASDEGELQSWSITAEVK